MRITKVYTRTGDAGTTRLVGGVVVEKDAIRIEAYGTVDELNSILGRCRALAAQADASHGRDRIAALLKPKRAAERGVAAAGGGAGQRARPHADVFVPS